MPSKQYSNSKSDVFWAEVAPCEHLLELYDDDEKFLDSLESFVTTGLACGDGVIVIATPAHRKALRKRLGSNGSEIDSAARSGRYIALDAKETLGKFMNDDWPDDDAFETVIRELLLFARANGRHVRAFGEMVALLWADGKSAATVRLEYLWNNLCQAEGFSLFCAYPKIGLTNDLHHSIEEIRAAHSRIINNGPSLSVV